MLTANLFGTAKAKTMQAQNAIAKLITVFTAALSAMFWQLNAFALSINTSYTVKSSIANVNPEGLVLGISFWICRLIGIGMFVWGLYSYITARRGGDSEAMNSAMNTLIGGIALVCMPSILTALGII